MDPTSRKIGRLARVAMSESPATQLQDWIERMNAGEAAARDVLIQHVYEQLRRLTRKLFRDFGRLKRWEEDNDVLHGAFVRLLKALRDVPPASAGEFFGMATLQIRRELLDLVRHHFGPEGGAAHHASVAPGDSHPAGEPPQSTYAPDRLASWTELHHRIAGLRPEVREVVELRWYQGLKSGETAAVLGISVPTVTRRWAEGRLKLGEFLAGRT
jgi:RNA polymerase sigma factor (sigma-70 family)